MWSLHKLFKQFLLINDKYRDSSNPMLLTGIYVQLLVLGLAFLWFLLSQRRGNMDLLFKVFALAVLLLGLWLASVWVYPPYWGLWVLTVIFMGLALWKFRQPFRYSTPLRSGISNIPTILFLLFGAGLWVLGLAGRGQNPEGLVIDLVSPFAPGDKACVLSGGLNSLMNQHNFDSDVAQDKGQIYALDLMGFDHTGFRVRAGKRFNPKPSDVEDYLAYGMAVHAPCDGDVVFAVGEHPDQPIFQKVRVKSNSLILSCRGAHVWMSHLKSGSLTVAKGDSVKTGQYLARIGNSGHTEEPHLHFHAETIIDPNDPWVHGDPVHMRFDGKLMARGDCFN